MNVTPTRTQSGIARPLYIIMCMLATLLALTACDGSAHAGDNGLSVAIDNSSCSDVPTGDITLTLTDDAGNQAAVCHYADVRELASSLISVEAGRYTVAAVVNGGSPDVLSGSAVVYVAARGITRVVVPVHRGTGVLPTLRVLFTLPEPRLPDYTPAKVKSRAAEAGYTLRCVAELYKAGTGQYRTGTDDLVLRKVVTPELQADGETYLIELEAVSGNYGLRLWTDYARTDAPLDDTYYNTENMQAISIVTEPEYTANTDAKDAACHVENVIALPETGAEIRVQLQRPLAKYRIIADDIADYRRLTERDAERYPPLETLTATVEYEGYFPSEFNIAGNRVTDSLTGIACTYSLAKTATDEDASTIAGDWILAGSRESSVTLTLTLTDVNGNVVCRTGGLHVAYRQGCLTTVRGRLLTGGTGSGGISIDTEWNDIVIRF